MNAAGAFAVFGVFMSVPTENEQLLVANPKTATDAIVIIFFVIIVLVCLVNYSTIAVGFRFL